MITFRTRDQNQHHSERMHVSTPSATYHPKRGHGSGDVKHALVRDDPEFTPKPADHHVTLPGVA
jgi:hypothetical protein